MPRHRVNRHALAAVGGEPEGAPHVRGLTGDEGLVEQCSTLTSVSRPAVKSRDDQNPRLDEERFDAKPVLHEDRRPHEGDVHRAVGQADVGIAEVVGSHLDVDLRMQVVEGVEDLGRQLGGGVGLESDDQPSSRAAAAGILDRQASRSASTRRRLLPSRSTSPVGVCSTRRLERMKRGCSASVRVSGSGCSETAAPCEARGRATEVELLGDGDEVRQKSKLARETPVSRVRAQMTTISCCLSRVVNRYWTSPPARL